MPTRIAVQAGNETHSVDVTGATVTVPFDALLTVRAVRVTVERVWDVRLGHGGVGISELTVPGVQARRTLVVPAGPAGAASTGDTTRVAMATDQSPPVVVLGAAPSVPSCYFVDARPYCSPDAGRGSEDGVGPRPHAAGRDRRLRGPAVGPAAAPARS